jgi:hypothetical protein
MFFPLRLLATKPQVQKSSSAKVSDVQTKFPSPIPKHFDEMALRLLDQTWRTTWLAQDVMQRDTFDANLDLHLPRRKGSADSDIPVFIFRRRADLLGRFRADFDQANLLSTADNPWQQSAHRGHSLIRRSTRRV